MNAREEIELARKIFRWLSREFPSIEHWLKENVFDRPSQFIQYVNRNSAVGSVLYSLLIAMLVSIPLFAMLAGIHLLLKSWKPRARVFISYRYQDRNHTAERAEQELSRRGIDVSRLPLNSTADHDGIIDTIYGAIQSSDILICIPGAAESYVESEIAYAYGQRKPVVLLLDPHDAPRVPNTAKKGIPVFDSRSLDRTGYQALAEFCSYLGADRRSTAALYSRAFFGGGSVSTWALALCFGSTMAINLFLSFGDHPKAMDWSALIAPYSIVLILAFTVSVLATIGSRTVSRLKLTQAITGKRFTPDDLPLIMPGNLRAEVIDNLYTGELKGLHEWSRAA